jgi:endogenous inhibitor of DNA gyrase (YacG/DUF329 family)
MLSTAKKCTMCSKPVVEAYHPFCSKRCADLDLGKWLNGYYAIPSEEDLSIEDLPSEFLEDDGQDT